MATFVNIIYWGRWQSKEAVQFRDDVCFLYEMNLDMSYLAGRLAHDYGPSCDGQG